MTQEEYKKKKQADLDKVVTMGVLLEYTDELLIPRFSDVMDEKIRIANSDLERSLMEHMRTANAELEHRLKTYIDEKLGEYTSEIFKRLEKTFQKDKLFKEKVIELLKAHKIGSAEDVAFLEGLVVG